MDQHTSSEHQNLSQRYHQIFSKSVQELLQRAKERYFLQKQIVDKYLDQRTQSEDSSLTPVIHSTFFHASRKKNQQCLKILESLLESTSDSSKKNRFTIDLKHSLQKVLREPLQTTHQTEKILLKQILIDELIFDIENAISENIKTPPSSERDLMIHELQHSQQILLRMKLDLTSEKYHDAVVETLSSTGFENYLSKSGKAIMRLEKIKSWIQDSTNEKIILDASENLFQPSGTLTDAEVNLANTLLSRIESQSAIQLNRHSKELISIALKNFESIATALIFKRVLKSAEEGSADKDLLLSRSPMTVSELDIFIKHLKIYEKSLQLSSEQTLLVQTAIKEAFPEILIQRCNNLIHQRVQEQQEKNRHRHPTQNSFHQILIQRKIEKIQAIEEVISQHRVRTVQETELGRELETYQNPDHLFHLDWDAIANDQEDRSKLLQIVDKEPDTLTEEDLKMIDRLFLKKHWQQVAQKISFKEILPWPIIHKNEVLILYSQIRGPLKILLDHPSLRTREKAREQQDKRNNQLFVRLKINATIANQIKCIQQEYHHAITSSIDERNEIEKDLNREKNELIELISAAEQECLIQKNHMDLKGASTQISNLKDYLLYFPKERIQQIYRKGWLYEPQAPLSFLESSSHWYQDRASSLNNNHASWSLKRANHVILEDIQQIRKEFSQMSSALNDIQKCGFALDPSIHNQMHLIKIGTDFLSDAYFPSAENSDIKIETHANRYEELSADGQFDQYLLAHKEISAHIELMQAVSGWIKNYHEMDQDFSEFEIAFERAKSHSLDQENLQNDMKNLRKSHAVISELLQKRETLYLKKDCHLIQALRIFQSAYEKMKDHEIFRQYLSDDEYQQTVRNCFESIEKARALKCFLQELGATAKNGLYQINELSGSIAQLNTLLTTQKVNHTLQSQEHIKALKDSQKNLNIMLNRLIEDNISTISQVPILTTIFALFTFYREQSARIQPFRKAEALHQDPAQTRKKLSQDRKKMVALINKCDQNSSDAETSKRLLNFLQQILLKYHPELQATADYLTCYGEELLQNLIVRMELQHDSLFVDFMHGSSIKKFISENARSPALQQRSFAQLDEIEKFWSQSVSEHRSQQDSFEKKTQEQQKENHLFFHNIRKLKEKFLQRQNLITRTETKLMLEWTQSKKYLILESIEHQFHKEHITLLSRSQKTKELIEKLHQHIEHHNNQIEKDSNILQSLKKKIQILSDSERNSIDTLRLESLRKRQTAVEKLIEYRKSLKSSDEERLQQAQYLQSEIGITQEQISHYLESKKTLSNRDRIFQIQDIETKIFQTHILYQMTKIRISFEKTSHQYEQKKSENISQQLESMEKDYEYRLSLFPNLCLTNRPSTSDILQALQDKIAIRKEIETLLVQNSGQKSVDLEKIQSLKRALQKNSKIIVRGLMDIYQDLKPELAKQLKSQSIDDELEPMLIQGLLSTHSNYYQPDGTSSTARKIWYLLLEKLGKVSLDSRQEFVRDLRASFIDVSSEMDLDDRKAMLDQVSLELKRSHCEEEATETPYPIDLEMLKEFDFSMKDFIKKFQDHTWTLTNGHDTTVQFEDAFESQLNRYLQRRTELIDHQLQKISDPNRRAELRNEIHNCSILPLTVILPNKTLEISSDRVETVEHQKNSREYQWRQFKLNVQLFLEWIQSCFGADFGLKDRHIENLAKTQKIADTFLHPLTFQNRRQNLDSRPRSPTIEI